MTEFNITKVLAIQASRDLLKMVKNSSKMVKNATYENLTPIDKKL